MKNFVRHWRAYLFAPVSTQGFHLMRRLWALTVVIKMLPHSLNLLERYASPQTWAQIVYIHPYRSSVFLISDTPAFVILVYVLMIVSCIALFFGRGAKIAMPIALIAFISFFERNLQPFHSESAMLSCFGFMALLFTYLEDTEKSEMPVFLWRLLVWQLVVMYLTSIWYKLLSAEWVSGHAVIFAFTSETYWPVLFGKIAAAIPGTLKVLTYIVLAWETGWILLLVPRKFWSLVRCPQCEQVVRFTLIAFGILMHGAWAILLREVYPLSFAAFAAYAGLLQREDFTILLRPLKQR